MPGRSQVCVTDNATCGAVDFCVDNNIPVLIHPARPRMLASDPDPADFGRLCREDLLPTTDELQCAAAGHAAARRIAADRAHFAQSIGDTDAGARAGD